ncbi:MAG: ATP-binding protein, partial [Pseudomonadota bacterium]
LPLPRSRRHRRSSPEEATLTLSVLPAPWLTGWAYTAYVATVLLLLGLAIRAHTRRLQQRSRLKHAAELEAINVQLTDEVAERKHKERQLEQEKQRAQTYFNVAEVVLVTIRRDGNIGRINRKGAALLEYDEGDLVDSDWVGYVADDYRSVVREELLRRLADSTPDFVEYLEYPILSRTGRQYLIAWHCTALTEEDGEPVVFCSGMDVTRVRSLEKRMRLREKMNAIGELAGGIAHDFNNILQAIYGFTTLALDRLDPGDERANYLRQVVNGAERARTLVKRILTFSNQKEYDLKVIDLTPVVEEACALLRGSLPATVEIRTRIDTNGALILGDPTRIHQMLMNLGTNAGQAMEDRAGTFDVQVTEVELSAEHITEGSRLHPGRHIMLRASDNGPGIDRETLDHIFDPFFTTKDTDGSTGLGLTVVHGIVQSHSGHIEVDSKPGRGTTFIVYIPVAEGVGQDLPRSVPELARGSERILLVDDEEWVVTVTSKILERQGYRVTGVGSGAAALEAVKEAPDEFDLIVTDETMPKMTGSELVDGVRTIRPDIPIMVISGKQAPKAVGLTRTRFLQKPFTADELNQAVRRILDD